MIFSRSLAGAHPGHVTAAEPVAAGRLSLPRPAPPKGRRGPVTPRVAVEDRILAATVPPGSRFKGYADFVVQDLVLRACCIRYRRERWLTPEGPLADALRRISLA